MTQMGICLFESLMRSSKAMTKSDLIELLAAQFKQLTARDAEAAVKAILDAIGDSLIKSQRIEIRGFGSFSIHHRAPRVGRNPRSGQTVMVPEKRMPHFKPGKALRELVDESPDHPQTDEKQAQ
jgi:integration host factor subunit beta